MRDFVELFVTAGSGVGLLSVSDLDKNVSAVSLCRMSLSLSFCWVMHLHFDLEMPIISGTGPAFETALISFSDSEPVLRQEKSNSFSLEANTISSAA